MISWKKGGRQSCPHAGPYVLLDNAVENAECPAEIDCLISVIAGS